MKNQHRIFSFNPLIMYFIFRVSWFFNTNCLFFVSFHDRRGPGRKPLSNNRKLFKNSRNFLRREIWTFANCMDTWCRPKLLLARFFLYFFHSICLCMYVRLFSLFFHLLCSLLSWGWQKSYKLANRILDVSASWLENTKNAEMNT